MWVDPTRMAEIAQESLLVVARTEHGEAGVGAVQRLMAAARQVYEALSPERLPHGLVILTQLDGTDLPLVGTAPAATAQALVLYADGPLTVTVGNRGILQAAAFVTDPALQPPSVLAYVYFPDEGDHVLIGGLPRAVPNPSGAQTALAVPYFFDLAEALEHYRIRLARRPGQCLILDTAWREPGHLVFNPKPESTMRRSLHRFLTSTLRGYKDVEVMPEQVVDESHPVDIKVTWLSSNKVALIEIKWLGVSAPPGGGSPATTWSQSRALDGAQQLVGYLDLYHRASAGQDAVGYLAVFDGRRRHVGGASSRVAAEDAMHYANAEITYRPEHLNRPDFGTPVRFFCEAIPSTV